MWKKEQPPEAVSLIKSAYVFLKMSEEYTNQNSEQAAALRHGVKDQLKKLAKLYGMSI